MFQYRERIQSSIDTWNVNLEINSKHGSFFTFQSTYLNTCFNWVRLLTGILLKSTNYPIKENISAQDVEEMTINPIDTTTKNKHMCHI